MKNGAYESKYQKEVITELKQTNALLVEHLISVRAALETIMVYLPAFGEKKPSKEVVTRLARVYVSTALRLQKQTQKALKKI
jgi:hypothetical protein